MSYLKPLRLWTTMYIVVLLNLTGIMYQIFVNADLGDYNAFITSTNTNELDVTTGPAAMIKKEEECERDIRKGILGVPEWIDVNELSMVQLKVENKKTVHEYTKLLDLNIMDKKKLYDKTQDLVIIIPGFQTSIKKATPLSIVNLIRALQNKLSTTNIFVLDVGEQFSKNYTYEHIVLKVPFIGQYFGMKLAQMKQNPDKNIHLIGIDIGASVAGIAAERYAKDKIKQISRISAINPVTLCLKGILRNNSANFVDVYIASNLYNETTGTFGKINYQIRDQKERSSCNRLLCATTKAVTYFTDSILKNKFSLYKCANANQTDDKASTQKPAETSSTPAVDSTDSNTTSSTCEEKAADTNYGYYLNTTEEITSDKKYQILYAKEVVAQ